MAPRTGEPCQRCLGPRLSERPRAPARYGVACGCTSGAKGVTVAGPAFSAELPELEGLTPKMYRGGKICVDMHFRPLWTRNSPRFGLAHVLCLGLGPWLAAEVPWMAGKGLIHPSG